MALTEQQREEHYKYVGSSTIAKIVGVHPYENISDAFLYATQRVEEAETSSAAKRGIAMEGYVLDLWEHENEGVTLARNIQLFSDIGEDGRGFCANLDAAIMRETQAMDDLADGDIIIEAPVEAKTANDPASHAYLAVPDHVKIQCQWQMGIIGPHCRYALVPVMLADFGRFKFKTFRVDRSDKVIEDLRFFAFDFLDHVRRDVMPPAITPHLEALKRVKRIPNSIISLGDDAYEKVAALQHARQQESHWKSTKDEATAECLKLLGDSECGILPDGRELDFVEEGAQRRCDWDDLERDCIKVGHPEIYSNNVKPGTRQVLRIRKPAVKKRRVHV